MRYRVSLKPFHVHGESADEAQQEAFQALFESLDLLEVTEDRDRSAELYEAEMWRAESALKHASAPAKEEK